MNAFAASELHWVNKNRGKPMNDTVTEPIYSTMAADEDFGDLVEIFVEEVPNRIALMAELYGAGDLEELQRVAHQLKGAAGSYGFVDMTPYAANLEAALRDGQSQEAINAAYSAMVDACGRVRAGTPS